MPITPEVYRLNEQFRAMLLANERRAASSMVRYYGTGWAKLQKDIEAVTQRINQARDQDKPITRGTIVELEQMRTLQMQVEQELNRFAKYADSTVQAQERVAIAAAERQSYELINASFPGTINDAVQIDFYRLPSESVESLVGFLQDGTPLGNLIDGYAGDAAKDFGETLVSGLIAGDGPRETARALRNAYGMGLTKALQISRTETLRAYRTATLASYQANDDVLNGWVRSAAKDDRTCAACIALDGKVYTLAEDMDDHVQGRCAMIPITKTYAELGIDAPEPEYTPQSGREWFEQQDEATQRKILGSGKYDAWKDGKFTLDQIAEKHTDSVWGDSWTPAPLYKLLGQDAPVGTYGGWKATEIIPGFTQEQSDAIHRAQDRIAKMYNGQGSRVEVSANDNINAAANYNNYENKIQVNTTFFHEHILEDTRASDTARAQRNLDSWKETLKNELALGASPDSEFVKKAENMIEITTKRLEEMQTHPVFSAAMNMEDLVLHEYGHAITYDWKQDRISGETGAWIPFGESIVDYRERTPDYKWENTLEYKMEMFATTHGDTVSEYAMTNSDEYMAEAFVRYTQGRKDEILQPDLLAFFERILK